MSKFTLSTNTVNRTVGVTKAVTTTSDSYALSGLGVALSTIRIANTGAVGLYYALDDDAVTATTNDVFLPAGSVEFVPIPTSTTSKNGALTSIGFICAAGTTGLNITNGVERVSE